MTGGRSCRRTPPRTGARPARGHSSRNRSCALVALSKTRLGPLQPCTRPTRLGHTKEAQAMQISWKKALIGTAVVGAMLLAGTTAAAWAAARGDDRSTTPVVSSAPPVAASTDDRHAPGLHQEPTAYSHDDCDDHGRDDSRRHDDSDHHGRDDSSRHDDSDHYGRDDSSRHDDSDHYGRDDSSRHDDSDHYG